MAAGDHHASFVLGATVAQDFVFSCVAPNVYQRLGINPFRDWLKPDTIYHLPLGRSAFLKTCVLLSALGHHQCQGL